MSYILDALRRSEQERHQEQIKSLTGQDALIHVNKVKPQIWPYLLILVLIVNAGIFMWMHLDQSKNDSGMMVQDDVNSDSRATSVKDVRLTQTKDTEMSADVSRVDNDRAEASSQVEKNIVANLRDQQDLIQGGKEVEQEVAKAPTPSLTETVAKEDVYVDGGLLIQPKSRQGATLPTITHTQTTSSMMVDSNSYQQYEHVPYLVDTEQAFQRQIPRLTFNSHIYSDMPSARRVMINNIYLREGQQFSGLEVVEIGEREIVFSKNGTLFKRPVMRDW